ncbi:hypothetical protein PPROV_000514600, partial [Pycnococcus provasolii]
SRRTAFAVLRSYLSDDHINYMIHFTLKLPTKISAPEVDSYYHKEYGIVDQDNRTATDPLTWHDVWNTDEWSERDYHFTMRVIDVNAYRTMQSVHSFDKTLQFFYGELSDVLFDNPWWKAEEEKDTSRYCVTCTPPNGRFVAVCDFTTTGRDCEERHCNKVRDTGRAHTPQRPNAGGGKRRKTV